jgi:hypothetical protein
MIRFILIFLILSNIINATSQQIYSLNITNQKPNTISVLNPAIASTQMSNSIIMPFIGYSSYSFHYYAPNETMIYREGDMLWIYLKDTSTSHTTVSIEFINPFNNIIINTIILTNTPINIYNFSDNDPTGYWTLKIFYKISTVTISESIRILLINIKQNVTFNITNQALIIKQGDLVYTVNGTLIFLHPITEYQALLFPINQSINTIITSIHGEKIKIIGLTNSSEILIEAESLLQFGIQASLKIQRPISIANIKFPENYQVSYIVYWYPLLYTIRNTTPSTHHKIIIPLNQFNKEPLILTISLLDPKSQQEYDTHSLNLLYLPLIGIYSYDIAWNIYSRTVYNVTFQTNYRNYIHTKYILVILSRTFGLLYMNQKLVSPPFIKINVVDQSMNPISNYQLTFNSSINTIFYDGATYIIPTSNSSTINVYYNITIQNYKISINYESFKKMTLIPGSTIILNITLHTITINLYAWGKPLNNPSNIIFQINKLNDSGGTFQVEASPIILKLPPGIYSMKIFANNILSWSENATINSDQQINVELYREDPVITILIIIIGGIIIISEFIIGIRLIQKMFSK